MAVGRSGSTLLQGILNAFPKYLIRGENGAFILHLFRTYQSLRQTSFMASTPTAPQDAWFGAELTRLDEFVADAAMIITRQLLGDSKPSVIDAIGFKEIRWLPSDLGGADLWSYLNFIALMFPFTKFILLTRNIEDIMKSGWWAIDGNPEAAAKAIEAFYLMARHAPVKKLFELDYSDLEPESANLHRLADFLGQKYVPAINDILALPHSDDTSESNLREQEIKKLKQLVDGMRPLPKTNVKKP